MRALFHTQPPVSGNEIRRCPQILRAFYVSSRPLPERAGCVLPGGGEKRVHLVGHNKPAGIRCNQQGFGRVYESPDHSRSASKSYMTVIANLTIYLSKLSMCAPSEVGLDGSKRFQHSYETQCKVFAAVVSQCASVGGRVLSIHSPRPLGRCYRSSAHRALAQPCFTGLPEQRQSSR